MKRSGFTEEQIIRLLKEGELCRRHNISKGTYYSWRSKYGGLEVSELKRLRSLEEENSKLKRLLADSQLDNLALKPIFRAP